MKPAQRELLDYQKQVSTNEDTFKRLMQKLRPDLYAFFDMFDTYKISPLILMTVIKHLVNIATGNRYGTITISIENGNCTFIRGEESNRLNEKIIQDNK